MYWDVCKQTLYRASREPARGTPVAGTDRPHEQMSDTDGPVVGDGPARVVRDFPHVAIRVSEGSGHASPLGARVQLDAFTVSLIRAGRRDRTPAGAVADGGASRGARR